MITHGAGLIDCGALLDRFIQEVKGLGEKLAVLLIQLPPKSICKMDVADGFFGELRARIDAAVVLEPRHVSWFTPDVDDWLAERRIARVAADPARVAGAEQPGGWKGLSYYRWHGSPRVYYSNYDAGALAALQRRLAGDERHNTPVWCMFDNTAGGAALGNALDLSQLCQFER